VEAVRNAPTAYARRVDDAAEDHVPAPGRRPRAMPALGAGYAALVGDILPGNPAKGLPT
jgi:hypothetical protein